jgi:hypothetical protein
MKLPTVLRSTDTAAKLAEARTALAAAETQLASLQEERATALRNDDIAAARRLDRQIGEQHDACVTYADRVTLLQAAFEQERRDERARRYQAAVDRLDKDLLPPRLRAVDDLAAGLRMVAAAYGQLHQGTGALFRAWPAGVPQGSYGDRWSFDAARAERCIKECLSHLTCDWSVDARLRQTEKEIADFAAKEIQYHANTVAELREQGPPEPKPDQEQAA